MEDYSAFVVANVMWYTKWPDSKFEPLVAKSILKEARDLYGNYKRSCSVV